MVVGARTAPKEEVVWTADQFVAEAGIDKEKVIRVAQGHTDTVVGVTAEQAPAYELDKSTGIDKRIKAEDGKGVDAVWTKDTDLTLMIGSADCAAITISGKDKDEKPIVGIAHSGIAGTQKDIASNLIHAMAEEGGMDIESANIYVAPSICQKCYPVLSESASDEQVAKAMSKESVFVDRDDESIEVQLTSASVSFKKSAEKYGDKFRESYGRDLHQNDFFYVAKNSEGVLELHYNVDNQILVSLIGNGVSSENIGFSQVCTKNDGLPSSRGTKETTGVFTTIGIK